MPAVVLFIFALAAAAIHKAAKKESYSPLLLRYLLLLNVGVMGFLAAYAHLFMAAETARAIGWQPGSPFQFEIGMANLSYGVLGIIAFWAGRQFRNATIIGWSVLLLGCFVGHIINYLTTGNTAPLNMGVYIWFNDLFLPLLVLALITMEEKAASTLSL